MLCRRTVTGLVVRPPVTVRRRTAMRVPPATMVIAMLTMLALPVGAESEPKSAEDIIKALTGVERGPQRAPREPSAPAANGPTGKTAAQVTVPIHFGNNSADIRQDSSEQLKSIA